VSLSSFVGPRNSSAEQVIAVTGATGFVGRALCEKLVEERLGVRALVRDAHKARASLSNSGVGIEICPLAKAGVWSPEKFEGVRAVVHMAARAHVLREADPDPTSAFLRANRDLTLDAAKSAAEAGVERFVFVSTIGVNGRLTNTQPFRESALPNPHDAYSAAKWEAEKGLWALSKRTGLEVVVLRPPLVYGRGVPANFRRLLALAASGIPLPLGSVVNQRSLLYVRNMVDVIVRCIEHPAAAGQTFLVSDGEDVSTPELIRRLATALGRPARLISVPMWLLNLAGRILGKTDEISRLTGSLQIDSSRIRQLLDWTPPFSMKQGLAETATWYRGLTDR
jgi:nucleoside-diphosphate-sugar epimerase